MSAVERNEDMGRGVLTLFRQEDGDIIVSVAGSRAVVDVEFCAIGAGGGRSPRTIDALYHLFAAMQADNASDAAGRPVGESMAAAGSALIALRQECAEIANELELMVYRCEPIGPAIVDRLRAAVRGVPR